MQYHIVLYWQLCSNTPFIVTELYINTGFHKMFSRCLDVVKPHTREHLDHVCIFFLSLAIILTYFFSLRKMGLLFLRQIFWWLIQDFTLQMAVRRKHAMKCTLYFLRKCYLLEQNRNIFGVSTSKLVRNSNGVHSANMFTNWTPRGSHQISPFVLI